MQKTQGKFLVEWIESLSRQQIFFFLWVAIGAFFAFLFWRQFGKTDQRHFRAGNTKSGGRRNTAIVVANSNRKSNENGNALEVRK